jgi:hypothetical protein
VVATCWWCGGGVVSCLRCVDHLAIGEGHVSGGWCCRRFRLKRRMGVVLYGRSEGLGHRG